MYEIIFTEKACKQLNKLEKDVQRRIIATLDRCRINPYRHFIKLVGETAMKLRVGEWRVIADINEGKLIVLVLKIGHRRNIYKN